MPETTSLSLPSLTSTLLVVLSAELLLGCASSAQESQWPGTVVSIEQMRATKPLRASVPTRSPDRTKTSTVVMLIHVDKDGQPVHWRVEQSSGNGRLDEAAMHSIRTARFVPYQVDGVSQAVTVVAPMHFPFAERGSR